MDKKLETRWEGILCHFKIVGYTRTDRHQNVCNNAFFLRNALKNICVNKLQERPFTALHRTCTSAFFA